MMSRTICEWLGKIEAQLGKLVRVVDALPSPKGDEVEYKISKKSKVSYCGLTIDQWQRIVAGKYIVGVSDESIEDAKQDKYDRLAILTRVAPIREEDNFPFSALCSRWRCAAIPSMICIRKPHFGGSCPTNHVGDIACKMRDGDWSVGREIDHKWEWSGADNDIMEYVELP